LRRATRRFLLRSTAWTRGISGAVLGLAPAIMADASLQRQAAITSDNHLHYLIGGLLIVQAVFLIVLIIEHRRHVRARADSQRQYTELTHAGRLALAGEISASIAHEVTQPLSAILSNVETVEAMLRKPAPDLAAIREILEDVRQDDLRAHGIVRKLRMLLRKHEMQFEHVDVNALASSVLSLVLPDALRRNVVIHTTLDPALPKVPADPVHLQQVLLNLIINAMEAMEETPTAARWLEVRTERCDAGHVQVAVADNGRGLAADRADKLFESFFTTKTEGMGLGLSMARSIVALHGGAIWAENSKVGGATFLFTLPVSTT
jgi:two-component system sensor kinase FixL